MWFIFVTLQKDHLNIRLVTMFCNGGQIYLHAPWSPSLRTTEHWINNEGHRKQCKYGTGTFNWKCNLSGELPYDVYTKLYESMVDPVFKYNTCIWDFLFYVFPCVILFLCFSVLLALQLPRLGKRELIVVLFIRLFDLSLFGFVGFLFLLVSVKGCGLWLWHSLDFSLTFFFLNPTPV